MTMSICGTFETWHSRASGCSKAQTNNDTTQHHEETSLQRSSLDTKQRRQQ
jgi:hypothetical protein